MKTLSIIAAFLLTVTAVQANNDNSIDPDKTNPYTEVASYNLTPLCYAAAKGDVAKVKELIELGADVDATSRGYTPLMYAARYNHCKVVKALLNAGAEEDVKHSVLKKTAYDFAAISNADEAMTILDQ
ncbi:ankyrin repeat domain-containing protein [Robertkochia sediminum]|uniref:ankyrin repeat domain-containing protein n=1 Tax=Robertkochia sediminum TaxID=2785326 RepID=UPI001932A593|nr:ankyrin repeat domain-containing protein [Robertkochia sediminum]MBL7471684.1 ankyrin repeat domain-containing protein [Robertkochia sediminum]